MATFAHRTSRAGDPQLHTHCLIPNIVRRADGAYVAFDANPLHIWAKATGTVFLNELERTLTERLGVEWGPERNGCTGTGRVHSGPAASVLEADRRDRDTSRSCRRVGVRIEAERMRADDRASLATRQHKDGTVTAEAAAGPVGLEAATVGLEPGPAVDDLVVGRQLEHEPVPAEVELFAALVDPETGLCATDSRFNEAHVVERVAAMSGGRRTVDDIVDLSRRFLASESVVRSSPAVDRRRPAEWSTVELRGVEDQLLTHLQHVAAIPGQAVDPAVVEAAIAGEARVLGDDQADAVRMLCGAGPSARTLVAPVGYGKTTALHAAATARMGRRSTRRGVGADAQGNGGAARSWPGRGKRSLGSSSKPKARRWLGTTVMVDEMSQVGTRHATALAVSTVT